MSPNPGFKIDKRKKLTMHKSSAADEPSATFKEAIRVFDAYFKNK